MWSVQQTQLWPSSLLINGCSYSKNQFDERKQGWLVKKFALRWLINSLCTDVPPPPFPTWCSDLRVTANQIIFHTFRGKSRGLHTRLATVNHRRLFSDFSCREGESVHRLLLKGLTRFMESLLFYFFHQEEDKKKPLLEGCYLLAFSFQPLMKSYSFYGCNNSNIPSSRQPFSVDAFHVSNLKTFLVCQKLFKYNFFLSLLRKDNKL